jgi:hypothetical protein
MTVNNIATEQQVFIKMVLDAWQAKTGQLDKLLTKLTDTQLQQETAPGKNRGIYLLGHLTALADSIHPLLGYEKAAPQLFGPFVSTPDKQTDELPSVNELRQEWVKVKTSLEQKMAGLDPGEWFRKHTAVSEEDFAKEPHRNKLNVVLSRIGHTDYHLGQMQFLKTN